MTVRLLEQSPETRGFAAAGAAIVVTLEVEAGATSRNLAVKVGSVTVLTWTGGSPTISAGYSGSATLDETSLAISLTKDGGWTSGAAVEWAVVYHDSLTSTTSFEGSFAQVAVSSITLRPGVGASDVSRRPHVYAEAVCSAGTHLGVDLALDGEDALLWGAPQTPAFEGRAGALVAGAFGLAQPRRAFAWGARVSGVARPVVDVSGTAYRGRVPFSFAVVGRPARPSGGSEGGGFTDPVRETVRRMAASVLRPDPGSPSLPVVMGYYLARAEVGRLALLDPRTPTDIDPVDIPDAAALLAFVEHVRPLWRALLEGAPSELRESLSRAWASGHAVEQVAAVCVVLSLRD